MADRTIKPDDTHDLVLQNNHGASKIEVNENDTIVVTSGGDVTIDATGDIVLDADGADIKLKDGGVQFGTLKQASGHLVIQPESSKEIILNDQGGAAALTVDIANQNVSINNGSIVISTAGQGITFGGDPDTRQNSPTVGPRTLYDYEQGDWTPILTSYTGAITTVGAVSGTYTKIGNIVVTHCILNITTNGTGGTFLKVAKLPFAFSASADGDSGYGKEIYITGKALAVWNTSPPTTIAFRFYDGSYPGSDGCQFSVTNIYRT